jgi:hypothetical protein
MRIDDAKLAERIPKNRELLVDDSGHAWHVHGRATCKGRCALHRPSEHKMRGWKVFVRETGLIERICPAHGVGHPDPDSVHWFTKMGYEGYGVHGCCGCCQ